MTSATEPHPASTQVRPRIPAWVINSILAVLIIAAAFIPFSETGFRSTNLFTLVVTLLPAAILPLRHRWPIPVLAGFIVFYGVGALAGTLAPGLVLAIAVAMFSLANQTTRRTTVIAGLAAMLAMGILSLLAALGDVFDPRVVQFLFTIAFAAAAGDGARSRREFIAAITDRAVRAEETKEAEAKRRVTEERLRIARDLHDVVAHQIAVISLNAGVASASLESRPEKAQESLGTIRSAARVVLGEIGDLLDMLRSDSDDPADASLPQPGLDGLDNLVATFAASGLDVNLRVEGDPGIVSGATALVAYRLIQEALTNAHKYGAESRAHVLVDVGESTVNVVVTNPSRLGTASDNHPSSAVTATGVSSDGGRAAVITGSDTRAVVGSDTGTGLGLVGLRERVASVRGTVETGFVGGGYRVRATLPRAQGETR
ncbi:histidine kinase [Salinibacterium sp. SWN1162]|uniref:histidine kinase n=1 Tax=Salinibacterium sp. SWN1162 TaxID=2792053 RepID=UPI0018CEB031|nr:histidine kinase [Salinibacterium sp. SWN1162]MBH0008696.1 sensor histidine kinase [Salinibacterium sp. SWN1162]